MSEQDTIAVIGAGVIGAAVALALAREGRKVLLLDRAEPGVAGASFGNVGHIAAELVQPLPSPGLLFGFWRELYLLRRCARPAGAPGAAHAALDQSLRGGGFPARATTPGSCRRWCCRPPRLGRAGFRKLPGPSCCAAMVTTRSDSAGRAQDQMRANARTMARLGIKTREVSSRAAAAAAARGQCIDRRGSLVRGLGARD